MRAGTQTPPLSKVPQPLATLVATIATFLLAKQASSTQGNEEGEHEEKASPPRPGGYRGLDSICFSGTWGGRWWLMSPAPRHLPGLPEAGHPARKDQRPGEGADGSHS